ncbi:hypothetical protein NUW54_g11418 [Trametes sanguinea]|uniref:Uncharacterized protein n=1 Tax=Trametes sanguinea TaxID=158606 RepID=A0ACC1NGG3_9APHY|nr:hypothetical protein NUW54_g11418 [Trametes sanguinea]
MPRPHTVAPFVFHGSRSSGVLSQPGAQPHVKGWSVSSADDPVLSPSPPSAYHTRTHPPMAAWSADIGHDGYISDAPTCKQIACTAAD